MLEYRLGGIAGQAASLAMQPHTLRRAGLGTQSAERWSRNKEPHAEGTADEKSMLVAADVTHSAAVLGRGARATRYHPALYIREG